MKRLFIFSAALCALLYSPLTAALPLFDPSFAEGRSGDILVHNRIFLKIGGKPISLIDVVRKMDLLFYRQFPQLASSPMARYQFYVNGWRAVLDAVIDDALMVNDAEEKGVEVTDGEVREELEALFGPDVVVNLDQVGLTLPEAFELLKTELIVQKMQSALIRNPAQTEVYPWNIRKRYEERAAAHTIERQWIYRIFSIRGADHRQAAEWLYGVAHEEGLAFDQLREKLTMVGSGGVIGSYSEPYCQKDREIAANYMKVLETLSAGEISTPLSTAAVSRLFFLEKKEESRFPQFKEMEEQIRAELLQEAMAHCSEEYHCKLREQWGLTESYLSQLIPENLTPFSWH